ncbi:membrane bound O-acyl transferase family-domain-containing protein [Aspergillus avenaceus]|uniref:Membrane bound O-acyl transferase family-domain-containing protein n=1 Tax=Aspergillus avenaceus TaxID=36643 RepID=A0A5N6U6J4_ASPAV|nr:membrane bound O-acyl transferase family-domain-containing protein [Aspergillus avenaceus]
MDFLLGGIIAVSLSLCQALQNSFILTFTKPSTILRSLGMFCLGLFCLYQCRTIEHVFGIISYRHLFRELSIFQTAHSLNLLTGAGVSPSSVTSQTSTWAYIRSGFALSYNMRGIRTSWQIRPLPLFPSYMRQPKGVNRQEFLLRQTFTAIWIYLLLDTIYEQWKALPLQMKESYGPGTELLFSKAQICARAALCTAYIILTKSVLDFFYRSTSIITVWTGYCQPEDWPPLFGSIWDAYSQRRFWGVYWHQLLKWLFLSIRANTVPYIKLLPGGRAIHNTVATLLIFTVSGILHAPMAEELRREAPGRGSSHIVACFSFCSTFAAIETVVIRVLNSHNKNPSHLQRRAFAVLKILGYVWVIFTMSTMMPLVLYPILRLLDRQPTDIIPVSLVRMIGRPMAYMVLFLGVVIGKCRFDTSF